MIFDPYGRPIHSAGDSGAGRNPEADVRPGVQIIASPRTDRNALDASRGLIPREVDRIMMMANSGDVEDQCRISRELPEKNHAVAHALQTRRRALTRCRYRIVPGNKSPAAKDAAMRLEAALKAAGGIDPEHGKLGSFRQLLRDLTDALLPGFAASEIVWRPGGVGFYGFRPVEQWHFSFNHSFTPRLRVIGSLTDGIVLPAGKIIFHELGENGPDPVRGGLIRPLAWLHCFAQINLKQLLSFMERYGMPFVVAKVDENTWKTEGDALNALILNFGPNGGAVFSKNTELQLLQAANVNADGFFRLQEYLDKAIARVLLGQTASSGDGGGLSGDTAQSEVRDEILEADARQIEETVNRDLFAVWTRYNCAPSVPAPELTIMTDPAEDIVALASALSSLKSAGLQTDPTEMSERFGFKLERVPEPVMPAPGPTVGLGSAVQGIDGGAEGFPSADANPAAIDAGGASNQLDAALASVDGDALAKKYNALAIAIRAGLLTPSPEIEARIRAELGLPDMPDAAKAAWASTGGIRQPITLKAAETPAPETSPSGTVEAAEAPAAMSEKSPLRAAFVELFGPMSDQFGKFAELSDAEFDAALAAGETPTPGDPDKLGKLMTADMEGQYHGAAR